MSELTPLGKYGLIPYDLPAPKKGLLHALMRKRETTEVKTGTGEDVAILRRTRWQPCREGCCEGGDVWQIAVPCDRVPHCNACECSSEHIVTLSDADLSAFKALLP